MRRRRGPQFLMAGSLAVQRPFAALPSLAGPAGRARVRVIKIRRPSVMGAFPPKSRPNSSWCCSSAKKP